MADPHPSDDEEIVPVPMNRETIRRLAALGRTIGRHPVELASKLLHDLLRDDEFAHMNPLSADEPDPKLKPN